MTKTVLITGASSGIGRMTAELFAERGWQVAATARDAQAVTSWAADPRLAGRVGAFVLDVPDEASIDTAVSEIARRFGRIDVVVNNAGFGVFGPLEGASAEQVERQLRTNVLGTISVIRRVMPILRAQGGGTIVNVS